MAWRVVGFAVVVLSGCGPDWSGIYVGPLGVSIGCDDGSTSSIPPDVVTWFLDDAGDAITATPSGGACGSFTLAPDGDTARFQRKTCPVWVADDGIRWLETIAGGTLRHHGDSVSVSILVEAIATRDGDHLGTCDQAVTGTLHLQE